MVQSFGVHWVGAKIQLNFETAKDLEEKSDLSSEMRGDFRSFVQTTIYRGSLNE